MAVSVSGEAGSLRWGYRPIASVLAWTLTTGKDGAALSGRCEGIDGFGITQHPLTFCAHHDKGMWRFPVLELQISDDGALNARLGPKES